MWDQMEIAITKGDNSKSTIGYWKYQDNNDNAFCIIIIIENKRNIQQNRIINEIFKIE